MLEVCAQGRKLFVQILTAILVLSAGIKIDRLHLGGAHGLELGWVALPVTVFWIVGMTNAVNLIDGLDGLATGLSAIAVGAVGVFAIAVGQPVMILLMLTCLGTLLAFLVFNFNPATIFLGDSGSNFIGFFLGAGSVLAMTETGSAVGLAIPFIAMGIPIFDISFSMLRRSLERRSLFAPDRGHVHHRLLELGVEQKKVTALICLVSLLLTSLGLLMNLVHDYRLLALLFCLAVILLVAFRVVGAVRLGQTLEGVKRKRSISRAVHEELGYFEEAELMLRESTSMEDWWQSLCNVASVFGFSRLSLSTFNPSGTDTRLLWSPTEKSAKEGRCTCISLSIPRHKKAAGFSLEASIHAVGSTESAGRKMVLFIRLVEGGVLESLQRLGVSSELTLLAVPPTLLISPPRLRSSIPEKTVLASVVVPSAPTLDSDSPQQLRRS